MNVLVHACYINPNKGSEFSVSWNYVLEMSKNHHLYVLVGSTTEDLGDYSALQNVSIPNVDFIFPDTGQAFKIVNRMYHSFLHFAGAWTRYIAYYFWNKHIYRTLERDKSLLSKIDIIHFLSPVGWHEIGYLYKLGKPCIWGPVGGFTNCRSEFYKHYTDGGRKIALKNLSNSFSALMSLHLKKAMKGYDLIIANTRDTLRFIQKHYKTQNLEYFPENSMRITDNEIKNETYIEKKYDNLPENKIECIWCGSLDDRKMPLMLLDIVSQVKDKNKIHIKMVGGGYLEERIRLEIERRNLSENITICGQLPREQVRAYFEKAHLHILTSAYEANTTVMFEAMEECVPSIIFDHFGMADLVKDSVTGRKIPVADYEMMCNSFAKALNEVCEKPELLKTWALALRGDSKSYTAEKRAKFFEQCYQKTVKNHGGIYE